MGVVKFHFGVVGLGHPGGDGALQLCLGHFLPDLAEGNFRLHPQHFVEVGIGIRVHHQNGAVVLLAQIINDHTAGCGFAHAALAGNCDGMGCSHSHMLPLLGMGTKRAQ